MPAEISRRIGVPIFLITNASGGIRRSLSAGDIVIISDHIRMNHLTPLAGPHAEEFGPRFPDQTQVYNPELIENLKSAGKHAGLELTTGVYAFPPAPLMKRLPEIRAYEILGATLWNVNRARGYVCKHLRNESRGDWPRQQHGFRISRCKSLRHRRHRLRRTQTPRKCPPSSKISLQNYR